MSIINFHTKEISVKIVYYGPGLCGKTTSLQTIYRSLPENERPQLVSLATDVDRTIFFDFLPLTAYRIRDFKVRLQLYTVPGQVFYNATRKLVLNGADGVVFLADAQRAMQDSNLESLHNLEENLAELGLDIEKMPLVMQFNKRDLPDVLRVEEMDRLYNRRKVPVFATVATTGEGLFDALKTISQMVVNDLIRKGLGQQLRQHEETTVKPPQTEGAFSAGFATAQEAVTQTGVGSFWPKGEAARLGEVINKAVEKSDWREVVLAVDRLLEQEWHRWLSAENRPATDSLTVFLFMRGVSLARYRGYVQEVVAAKSGREILPLAAMNAVIIALETLWPVA